MENLFLSSVTDMEGSNTYLYVSLEYAIPGLLFSFDCACKNVTVGLCTELCR
jgi:hypothetical protein